MIMILLLPGRVLYKTMILQYYLMWFFNIYKADNDLYIQCK